jgi:hypothetical protein
MALAADRTNRIDARRLLRLVLVAAAVALAIAVIFWVLPEIWSALPREGRTRAVDRALRVALVVHALALPGLILTGAAILGIMIRTGAGPARRPRLTKVFLLCVSSVMALFVAEVGAAVRNAWVHRPPRMRDRRLPDQLVDAPGGEVRVAIIGGSSAWGYPYQPRVSVGQIVTWGLERAIPERRFRFVNLANEGANLEIMHYKLADERVRPDVLIIYCAHNEFQSRYTWSRTVPSRASLWERLGGLSPLRGLIHETIEHNLIDSPTPSGPGRQLVDLPMVTDAEYAARLADFRQRLEAIVTWCERQGTLPVLVVSPSNEDDWSPGRSYLPASATAAERRSAGADLLAARAEPDPQRAIGLFRALTLRHPRFAEAHYRLGRLLEHLDDRTGAVRHYVAARDADGLIIRDPTDFEQAYRSVAARHDCILVDAPAALRAANPRGRLDFNLFHDPHHPTFRGQAIIAESILRGLHARGAFGWKAKTNPAVGLSECAAHFGINSSTWEAAARRSAHIHAFTANNTYDPTERLEWVRRLEQASRSLSAGVPAESLGLPGFGVNGPWIWPEQWERER